MIKINPNDAIQSLINVEIPEIGEEEIEKHNIFTLLTLSLVFDNWCIQKNKPDVVEAYEQFDSNRKYNEYIGHNIGALLVDSNDQIVTAAMNCNYLHNDSTEHAESRLVRKGMRLYNRLNHRSGKGLYGYSSILAGHTIYTTLESCSQCSGIMDLANVKQVVYAQVDYGQGHIGNILYNMHRNEGSYGAPIPIRAEFLPIYSVIQEKWETYAKGLPRGIELTARKRPSTTGFLRSVYSAEAYQEATKQFESLNPKHGNNASIFEEAIEFRKHFNRISHRDAIFGP
jgi:tRNA(Arg) A34 adenosine deaminase TadA